MIDYIEGNAILVLIYALVALSLNFQLGMAGLLNYGQIAFFLVGAYAAAIVVQHTDPGWMELLGIPAGAALGALMTLPVRRLSQDYWWLVTLGVAEILRLFLESEEGIANGPSGVVGIEPLASQGTYLWILAGIVLLSAIASERIRRAPYGRALRVLREDEAMASALGRDVFSLRLRVMMLGGAMAAGAGMLYAHYFSFVSPDQFTSGETFLIFLMILLGGQGNTLGVLIGVVLVQTTSEATRFVAQWVDLGSDRIGNVRLFVYGLVLVLVILWRPQGLLPERKRRYRDRRAASSTAPSAPNGEGALVAAQEA
ncbi:MAG TPA: branched-chain amino acid ABC transporter permease [Conexibacter sp.]|nr:branched-chain amino acid ABC transporter permease [Conexibacter sp.]